MKRKMIVFSVALLIVVCVVVSIFLIRKAPSISIDWQLHGIWIDSNLHTEDGPDFSIKGSIRDHATESDELSLRFMFPENFHLSLPDSHEERLLSHVQSALNLNFFGSCGYGYDDHNRKSVFAHFLVSTEKEFVLIHWMDGSGRFLVASTDASADPAEILDYFHDYILVHNLSDGD